MADGGAADFTLRLHNQVTGPARKMQRSIRDVSADLKDQQKFFAKGETEFQRKLKESRRFTDAANRDAIRGMRQRRIATERMALAAKRLQERQGERRSVGFQRRALRQREAERSARAQARRDEGLEPGMGVVSKAGAFAIAGALAAGAAAATFLAAKLASATVAAVDFGQRSRTALASILKDGPLAAQQFNEVRIESQKLGLDVVDTVGEFKMLANSGFSVPMARELVRMSGDLQALTGSSESASFALRAISQIKMKGRLQAEEITGQLAEHGVSADEVYKVLGKTLGKTREEILKMQKAGDLSADVAIPAILQAVRNQLGVEQSGGFALKMNTSSVGGMFRTMKAQVQNAFISLGDRVGPGITRAFQGIMAQIQAAVASPQMQAFGNAVVSLFDTISSLVGQTDFASLLVSAATALGTELQAAAIYIRDHGTELRESFTRFVTAMGTGLQMAADFFKPFIEFANSDFAKFMFTPLDEQGRNTASQIDDLAIRKGFAPASARGGAVGAAAAAAGASGTRVDAKFGDFNINLNGSAATPEGGLRSAVDQTRREMMAMLQDL